MIDYNTPRMTATMSSRSVYGNGYDHQLYMSDGAGTLSSGILSNGELIDRSWELRVKIRTPFQPIYEVAVRVQGSMTVGKLIHEIVREQRQPPTDFSRYNVWWPERNQWLLHTRTTLDQYGVQSDAQLEFRPSTAKLHVLLPSLEVQTITVDYSARIFQVVKDLCKMFNIRHCEELSLAFPVRREDLKFNTSLPIIRHGTKRNFPPTGLSSKRAILPASSSPNLLNSSMMDLSISSPGTPMLKHFSQSSLDTSRFEMEKPSEISAKQAFATELMVRPKSLLHKARMNYGWLDSSRSILEHGIDPILTDTTPTLCLRFKFHSFYDLNPKYDATRINQLFEQARWAIIAGHIDCTDDEAFMFAAYQVQAKIKSTQCEVNNNGFDTLSQYQTLSPSTMHRQDSLVCSPSPRLALVPPSPIFNGSDQNVSMMNQDLDSVIEQMLQDLERTCESANSKATTGVGIMRRANPVIQDNEALFITPELKDHLSVSRDKVLKILRRYKVMYVRLRELTLELFRRDSDSRPTYSYSLKDCQATPDVDLARELFEIRLSLLVPETPSQREEVLIRCSDKQTYAKWISAFRLGSKGRTLASKAEYEKEVGVVLEMLTLQQSISNGQTHVSSEIGQYVQDLADFLPERILQRAKSSQALLQRISEVHVKIKDLDLNQAKLQYIQAWRALPDFGRTYFIVHFDRAHCTNMGNGAKDLFAPDGVVLSVCSNKLEVLDPNSGRVQRTWNFCDMAAWTVNWDTGRVQLGLRDNKSVELKPLSANCKTLIEFIGGYVFLSQRDPSKSQQLDERAFHKLTGVTE